MAMVATGTPPGIWTVDNNESRPFKSARLHRDAEDRLDRVRGHHARQMGGAARGRNEDLNAFFFRLLDIGYKFLRTTVGTEHAHLIRDAEGAQDQTRLAHRRQVAVAAHEDTDKRGSHVVLAEFCLRFAPLSFPG